MVYIYKGSETATTMTMRRQWLKNNQLYMYWIVIDKLVYLRTICANILGPPAPRPGLRDVAEEIELSPRVEEVPPVLAIPHVIGHTRD